MTLAHSSRRSLAALGAFCGLALVMVVVFAGSASHSSAEQGQYLHFGGPGSGYLEVPDSPALNPISEITIEAWVRIASANGWGVDAAAEGCPTFVGKDLETGYWLGLECFGSTRLSFYVGGSNAIYSTGSVPLNEWTHIAVTYETVNVNFYINGALDSTVPYLGAMGSNTSPLRIGNDVSWDSSPIGDIDEVHIWNIVRSQQAINLDMATIMSPEGGLVGVWNMEGSADADVGGFSGSLVGDAGFAGTPLTAPPTQEPPYDKGDINCDHVTTPADAIPLLERLSGSVNSVPPCENPPLLLSVEGVDDSWWDASSGAGYIEIPHDPDLNPTDVLTIELWINLWSYVSPDNQNVCTSLVGKGYQSAYWLGICSGRLRFYPRGTGSSQDSPGTVPLREWTHVAVVANDTGFKFYINGQLDSEFSNDPAPLATNDHPLRIGSDFNWNFQPWAALDDVRIWNRALTPEEVQGVMSNPPILPPTGLVAQYLLDGNAEDSVNDHEGGSVGSVGYGTSLPPPYWHDIDCNGVLSNNDLLLLIAHLAGAGEDFAPPFGCEAIGTSTG